MEYIDLTDKLRLSRIAQGFWRLPKWGWGTEKLAELIFGCVERGVTTLDAAEVYGFGECESLLGRVFSKYPQLKSQIQLVSKCGIYNHNGMKYYDTSYSRIKQSCHESLERLGVDHIDLYLIHREDACFDPHEAGKALLELKKEGLVREIGVSNFDPFKFNALNSCVGGCLCTNQIEWNPCCFEHIDSGMIDMLTEKRIHPMIWSPLAGGKLFSDEEEPYNQVFKCLRDIADRHNTTPETIAYAYILYHPAGCLPIAGSSKPSRLDNAVRALDVRLERWEWYEIFTASGQKRLR